jgi:hypothetical protein
MDEEIETLEEFSNRVVEEIRLEATAQVMVCMLMAMKAVKDKTLTAEEAKFGGLIVISGNSLIAAKYREISGQSFDFGAYLVFPVFKHKRNEILQTLLGKQKFDFTETDDDKINVFIFYRGNHCHKLVEPVTSDEHNKDLINMITRKIMRLKDSKELSLILLSL